MAEDEVKDNSLEKVIAAAEEIVHHMDVYRLSAGIETLRVALIDYRRSQKGIEYLERIRSKKG